MSDCKPMYDSATAGTKTLTADMLKTHDAADGCSIPEWQFEAYASYARWVEFTRSMFCRITISRQVGSMLIESYPVPEGCSPRRRTGFVKRTQK